MNWFRLYHEIIFDPKIQRFSPEMRWRYVEILCMASLEKDRGTLPDLWTIAHHFRLTESKASRILDQFIAAGLVAKAEDGKRLVIPSWHGRQFRNDTSADRTRAYRQRHSGVTGDGDVTSHSRHGHGHGDVTDAVTVAPSDTDTDTDTESLPEKSSISPPETEKKKEKTSKKKSPGTAATFMLPDWVPPADWEAYEVMRRAIRKPMTDDTRRLAVGKLAKLRDAGQDPAAVLGQSVFNSWQGLFEVKDGSASRPKEEPIKYHVAPPDSPFRAIEREDAARLLAIFGGEGGQAATPEPGGGAGRPGVLSAG